MNVSRAAPSPRTTRRLAVLGALFVAAVCIQLLVAAPAGAAPYTGGFSPTIFDGLADLNGDNEASGRDDANDFYGDTDIIDGALDCDAWGVTPNAGTAGDGVINAGDDCTLIGYDGTADGVTITVTSGVFDWPDGPLPTVFNAADPDNPDIGDSDFAWSTINGRVDSSGNETINANDCHFGLIGATEDVGLGDPTDGADILGNTQTNTNPCGFANPPDAANNGLVDLNSDGEITAADSCTNGCFFRHNVSLGVVQAEIGQPFPASPAGAFTGGFSPTIIGGLADLNGDGIISGRDDSNAFYGDTSIIDGALDCNNWATENDGTAGDLVINVNDDCTLIGYDGTPDGITIEVVDGEFQVANGPLPTVFNAADPDNPDISDSDFAWSAIGGRVDSNGNEFIDPGDCHFGLIGQAVDSGLGDPTDGADILGNTQTDTNPCGFANAPDPANNGLVDLNSDGNITAADSCDDCFFGHDVDSGFVMALGPETLDLTPATATNPEDTQHTVTAHVEDVDGDPVAGVTVRFTVTGANPTSGTDTTDANGDATFTYTGANPGNDTITAFADTDNDTIRDPGEPQDTATKTWTARVATGIDLAPATATNEVNTTHTVTATVVDQFGDPVADQAVHFDVTGVGTPVPAGGDDTTDVNGQATFMFTNATAGTNTITACIDLDDDGTCDVGEAVDTATKTWTAVPPTCPGHEGDPRNQVVGTPGPDTLTGTGGADIICGLGGNDTLIGLGGNDLLLGGPGADELRGGAGADILRGGAGGDELRGGRGPDRLFGGGGNDDLFGGRGNDLLVGGRGNDHLDGGRGIDTCRGGPGTDTTVRCELH
jgi:hypothetical protein